MITPDKLNSYETLAKAVLTDYDFDGDVFIDEGADAILELVAEVRRLQAEARRSNEERKKWRDVAMTFGASLLDAADALGASIDHAPPGRPEPTRVPGNGTPRQDKGRKL